MVMPTTPWVAKVMQVRLQNRFSFSHHKSDITSQPRDASLLDHYKDYNGLVSEFM